MLFVGEYFGPLLEVGMGCLGKKFANDRLQKGLHNLLVFVSCLDMGFKRFMATVSHSS